MNNWSIEDFLVYGLDMGSLDVDFFLRKLNEANNNLDDDIGKEIFNEALIEPYLYIDNNKLNGKWLIENLIYNLFEIYKYKFIKKICHFIEKDAYKSLFTEDLEVDKNKLYNVLLNESDEIWKIYSNYIDTSYECELDLFDYKITDEDIIIDFLCDFVEEVEKDNIQVNLELKGE
jgi:hypothetical protein